MWTEFSCDPSIYSVYHINVPCTACAHSRQADTSAVLARSEVRCRHLGK